MLVALTGGIGCGKSTVLDIFCKNDWRTLDADDVAHLVLENYEFVYSNIIPYFGKSVVTVDGIVDRKKLADIVFSDLVKLHYLEDKMHPYIFDYIADDNTIFETETLERVAQEGQLMAYKHESFWQCMDALRDKNQLEALWASGKAPWKLW